MQDSRELIGNLLRGKSAERVGLAENIWPQTLERWIGEGYPTTADGKPVDPAVHFSFDMGGAVLPFDVMPLRGRSEVIQESEEWVIRRNGAGAAHKRWKKRAGVPEHIDFRMTSRQAWERDYRRPLLALDRARLKIDQARQSLQTRRAQGKFALASQLFVWENMRQSMGDVCLYESLLDDPDWIRDYNRVHTDFFQAHYRVVFEEAGRPDGFRMCEDLGYRGGLFCSPRMLEELIFPYFKEMIDFFHSFDIPIFLHSCGNVTAALDLIAAAGFDGLDPMEFKAGCRPLEFADKVGDRLVLRGGLDVRVLESGDRALIRREAAALIEGMKARGVRYIFGSDHSISTNVSYPAYQYALEVYRERMMY